jgi:hypothetical protein
MFVAELVGDGTLIALMALIHADPRVLLGNADTADPTDER